MEIEIHLDLEEAAPEDYPKIKQRLADWYAEGAEIRYDKECFGHMLELEKPFSYRVNLGNVNPIEAIRDLHARVYRLGAKAYIYFVPL
ncbi:MAG: hypothetical protein WBG28_12120 [Desulfobulbales bacterium]|jgi:hypothetical protein|nr:hypothetical protein [Desulfobulbaceae bacterium]MDH3542435.1 hypothetical protein [Desulfobulbaceae bacterium]MDH3781489.1 hypothetical protein [Desulfobulbaceae bacterium]PLX51700.1 MAG: hypothetical protein C0612_05065 [Desulfobulbaceae bacterium]HKJ14194.1 hypothetical protein [Desulfobulbales bacterium]